MKKRVENVRYRLPQKGKPRIVVTFSDGERLILLKGEVAEKIISLSGCPKGRTHSFVINEMAYDAARKARGSSEVEIAGLWLELREAVEKIGYQPSRIRKRS